MVTDGDDDDVVVVVVVNYGITTPDNNYSVGADYDTENDDDDICALVIYHLLRHFFQLSLASSTLQL